MESECIVCRVAIVYSTGNLYTSVDDIHTHISYSLIDITVCTILIKCLFFYHTPNVNGMLYVFQSGIGPETIHLF